MTAAIAQIAQQRSCFEALSMSSVLHQALTQPKCYPLAIEMETLRLWTETRNLLDLAWLILKSAHFRQESRGGHYREDYPETDPAWQVHTLVQGDRWWKAGVGEG